MTERCVSCIFISPGFLHFCGYCEYLNIIRIPEPLQIKRYLRGKNMKRMPGTTVGTRRVPSGCLRCFDVDRRAIGINGEREFQWRKNENNPTDVPMNGCRALCTTAAKIFIRGTGKKKTTRQRGKKTCGRDVKYQSERFRPALSARNKIKGNMEFAGRARCNLTNR